MAPLVGLLIAQLVGLGSAAIAPVPAGAATRTSTATTVRPLPRIDVPATGRSRAARTRAALATRVLRDLAAYWTATFPTLYRGRGDFDTRVGAFPFTSARAFRPPQCGEEEPLDYPDVEGDAFFCPPSGFIAWDDEALMPALQADFGPIAVAMVLAHEMGHAVQDAVLRDDVPFLWVHQELQADCFAGAWLRRVTSGASRTVSFHPDTIDDAVAALMTFSDEPGGAATDDDAHGSAFDRVSALQIGVTGGAKACLVYETAPPPVTLVPFSSREEERSGGNVSLPEAIAITRDSLAAWWKRTERRLPALALRGSTATGVARAARACGGVLVFEGVAALCTPRAGRTPTGVDGPTGATLTYDAAELRGLHRDIGDFAVATVLAQGWSVLWQRTTGRPTADRSPAAERQATCATGAWVRSLGPVGGAGGLSPGDLDELLLAIVDLPGPSSAFDAIAAARQGWRRGISACR